MSSGTANVNENCNVVQARTFPRSVKTMIIHSVSSKIYKTMKIIPCKKCHWETFENSVKRSLRNNRYIMLSNVLIIYLPAATKLGQGNIFTSVCQEFCPRGGVCLSACLDISPQEQTPPREQMPPPPDQAGHPWTRQTPPGPGRPPWTRWTPQKRQTPPGRHPPDQAEPPGPGGPSGPGRPPLADTLPPRPGRPPPREADSRIRSTSGRYASYWNAFLYPWLSFIPACISL